MFFRFRPDDENVGDRRICDPHLGALEAVTTGNFFGARAHSAGVRPGIGFGQAKTADQFTAGEAGRNFFFCSSDRKH